MSSLLIRQDLGPMVVGFALIMGALAVGLRIIRRSGRGTDRTDQAGRADRAGRAGRGLSVVGGLEPGWRRLIVHVLATAVGGYLLLMVIIIFYYYGVAPIAGNFVESAFSGCAMLIGLVLPVFLLLSWLAERKGWRI
jgi:hypothetical protein